ncbi:MAG TPA: hypothetical protein VGD01_01575 [Candidatus Elarobacter sp.]|jgi:streptogramin lyase
MRTGTLIWAALCAAALSACGGGGAPPAPQQPAGAPPAPAFRTFQIENLTGGRGIDISGTAMSLAVGSDGTVAFSDRFEWSIVSFGNGIMSSSSGFDGAGPLSFGRGADGGLYAGSSTAAGNTVSSTVIEQSSGRQWSFAQYPPFAILSGPDSATWVLTFSGMVRLNPDGTTTLAPVATATTGSGVALGPDGAFWIAEFGGAIERVPVHGAPQRFSVGGHPERITAGADGALWFLDDAGLVRRMTTAGSATTVYATGSFSESDAIASGGDGGVWLTHASGNELIRVSADGTIGRYAVPAEGTLPSGIAAAPDGTLYFVEENRTGLLLVHATPR